MNRPTRRPLPIRTRLTIYYAGVLAVILIGLGSFLVISLRTGLRQRAHDSLEAAFRPLAFQLSAADTQVELKSYLHGGAIANESGLEVIGQILDRSGHVVQSSGDPGTAEPIVGPQVLAAADRTGHWHEPRSIPGRRGEDIVVVLPIRSGPLQGSFVVLAQTLRSVDASVGWLLLLLVLAAPVALGIAAVGGARIAGAALGPVDTMTRTAAAIDASQAGQRLPEPTRNDELGRLARTLNEMLARLDSALVRERRFAADASHELRTPLALMGAEIDVTLRSHGGIADPRATLASIREEVTRLSRIAEQLLLLARADGAGGLDIAAEHTDLLDLALTVVARLQPLATAAGAEVTLDGVPAHAQVDPGLLGQGLANLVENAIRHGGPGTRVRVRVADGGGDGRADAAREGARITVSDDGPGIAAGELPRIFDPFYRVDSSRSHETGSSGLGLSITRAILDAHGGSVEVSSEVGAGSSFALVFPA